MKWISLLFCAGLIHSQAQNRKTPNRTGSETETRSESSPDAGLCMRPD